MAKAQPCSADQAFGPEVKGQPRGFPLSRGHPLVSHLQCKYQPYTGMPAAAWAGDEHAIQPILRTTLRKGNWFGVSEEEGKLVQGVLGV